MKLERIIFSVDNPADPYDLGKALSLLVQMKATLKIDMLVNCIGSYEGYLEPSFMVYAKDFDEHIRGMFFLDGQESIMRIPGDPRQECTLEYLLDGRIEPIGQLKSIPSPKRSNDAWTYVLSTGRYFTSEAKASGTEVHGGLT